ncbi:MAG TPA: hypothetical protein PKA02_02085 [Candidatus Saccharibacteria bacterium]|nr:hypothetical protein [Candidatus Saccharibacteria bacterium]
MTDAPENSGERQPHAEAGRLNELAGSIEQIAAVGMTIGVEAAATQEQLRTFRESGLSAYGESLLTDDQLLDQRLQTIGKDSMEIGAIYPVDHLLPLGRNFVSRTGGRLLGALPEGAENLGQFRIKQGGRIRKFAQQLRTVSEMLPEPPEDVTALPTPDISQHPVEVSQGKATDRDIELYFGRQFADLVTYFKHPQVQAALTQLREEWPTEDDMIAISFKDMDEPWEQAFTALGTTCNPESMGAQMAASVLLEAIDSWIRDPSGTVMSKITPDDSNPNRLAISQSTRLKLVGFKSLNSLYQDGAVRAAEYEGGLGEALSTQIELYEQRVREVLIRKKEFTSVLLATENETQGQLLERLALEARVDAAIGAILDAKPPRAKISPKENLEQSDIITARRRVLHEYIGMLAAGEQEATRNEAVTETLSELGALRSKYSLSRANFRAHADPNLDHTRNLVNGFTGILMGRQLANPVSKEFARDFLSTMYTIADDLNHRDAREVFDELLLDVEREDWLTERLGGFGEGALLADNGSSLRERLGWYVANELQLSGTMLRVLPEYVSRVLSAFDEYWNSLDPDYEPPTANNGSTSLVNYERAQEILGSLIELDFRLFPPDTSFDILKEELIEHVGKGTKRAERIQWQKLENLVLLYDYYGEMEGVTVNLFRALPGSLKQSFPYYVLELAIKQPNGTTRRVAIGENPIRDNATYVMNEDDQNWQTVFGYTKPEARQKGASRIWHSRDPKLREQHFAKIIDHVAQFDPVLLAFELSSGTQ